MIKDYDGTKQTPKQKAQDLIMHKVAEACSYWSEPSYQTDGMTRREIELVQDQIEKLALRIAKQYGYEKRFTA